MLLSKYLIDFVDNDLFDNEKEKPNQIMLFLGNYIQNSAYYMNHFHSDFEISRMKFNSLGGADI